ncbi:MAG: chromosomal replication initiator protein DnaA [Candidatus Binatia bacterium]
MEAEWLAALPQLREQVGERNFATWIEPIHCARDDQGLRLEVGSRFFQQWVTRHFLGCIRQTLAAHNGGTGAVRVIVAPGRAPAVPDRTAQPPPRRAPGPRAPKLGRLVPEYTFESFVVGHANEVACRAARAVAEAPGRQFNPFFLWGGVGLGKTHLINAVAHDLLRRPPRCRMACLSAEAFMNNMITSLRQDQMRAFRDQFRALDALILDDVEFLAGKERTQEEFFHTFNALYAAGKQVVLTSDKPPHAIAALEQRLRSRFEGGLIADIHPPTYQMRVEIVMKKAALQGVELPADVARVLAQRSGPSVRELEGALTRVLATAALTGGALDREMAQRVLAPVTAPVHVVSIEAVQEAVSRHFRLSVADLKSHRRARPLTFPRQVAMYLSRTLAEASFPYIAQLFGGRDHSTVMYAVRAVETRRAQDASIDALLSSLEATLRTRSVS